MKKCANDVHVRIQNRKKIIDFLNKELRIKYLGQMKLFNNKEQFEYEVSISGDVVLIGND